MTALQDLIDGASGDAIPVATLLRKVKVVVSRLGSIALELLPICPSEVARLLGHDRAAPT